MRRALPILAICITTACELTEVVVPEGEPRIVVQAILSRGSDRQFVYVEDARIGQAVADSFYADAPRQPLLGALVTLTYPVGTNCGPAVDTLPAATDRPGVYEAFGLCTSDPGDVVDLRVEAPDGRVVTGSTTIPGAKVVTVSAGSDTAAVGTDYRFDRDHDTLRVNVEPTLARAMHVEVRRHDSFDRVYYAAQSPLVFFSVFDKLSLSLPGGIVNPFEQDSGEVVFRAGVMYDVTVAVTDTNYYDFSRSFSDPLTGRGFINHLEGGLGVFGAVEPHSYVVRAVGDVDDPREGVYSIAGQLNGQAVDVTMELYLDALTDGVFAAFIDGIWLGTAIHCTADGLFGTVGNRNAFDLAFLLAGNQPDPQEWVLSGERIAGITGFQIVVRGTNVGPDPVEGALSAVQTSGPTP